MNAVHISVWWRETVALDRAAVNALADTLSEDERARAHRFHFARDARDYTAAHALMRSALAEHVGRPAASLAFVSGPHGQPLLLDETGARSRWSFSLSHTSGCVACAVALDRAVGIDVETLHRRVDTSAIAERYFSAAENVRLAALDEVDRLAHFIELWTLKEAMLKALGLGLSFPLERLAFDVRTCEDISLIATAGIDPAGWQFSLFTPGPAHRIAVATERLPGSTATIHVTHVR